MPHKHVCMFTKISGDTYFEDRISFCLYLVATLPPVHFTVQTSRHFILYINYKGGTHVYTVMFDSNAYQCSPVIHMDNLSSQSP